MRVGGASHPISRSIPSADWTFVAGGGEIDACNGPKFGYVASDDHLLFQAALPDQCARRASRPAAGQNQVMMVGWRRLVGIFMIILAIGGAFSAALPHDDFNDTPHSSEAAQAIESLDVVVAEDVVVADNLSPIPQDRDSSPAKSDAYDIVHCAGSAHSYLEVASIGLSDLRQHGRVIAHRNGFIRAFSASPSTPPPKVQDI